MIDIGRSVVTLTMLLITGAVGIAHAQPDDDAPSQLRLADEGRGEPSLYTIATAGFPAISASGAEIAVLRSLDAGEASVALDVMRVDGEGVMRRFILIPEFYEDGNPDSESARQRQAASMAESNAYLAKGQFKALEVLFDHTVLGKAPESHEWQIENGPLRIRYQNTRPSSLLKISAIADPKRAVRLAWPLIIMKPMGDGGIIQCSNKGVPMRAWTDATGELIVIYIVHAGGPHDGCDLPEEWRVLRLPH